MSFDYLSRPINVPSNSHCSNFDKDALSLSTKLTCINGEMSRILSLQEQVGGRRDGAELREIIQHMLRETGKKFERTEVDVKLIRRWERCELSVCIYTKLRKKKGSQERDYIQLTSTL